MTTTSNGARTALVSTSVSCVCTRCVVVPAFVSHCWKFDDAFSPGTPRIPMFKLAHVPVDASGGAASVVSNDGGVCDGPPSVPPAVDCEFASLSPQAAK